MKPLVHVDDGQFAIDVQNYLKAVRQRIFFKFNFGKGSFLAGGVICTRGLCDGGLPTSDFAPQ